jgi:hydrogenase maturation factor
MKTLKEITDMRLFLTYAYTCADSAIQRRALNRKDVKAIRDYVVKGIEPERDYARAFPMAWMHMTEIAERERQQAIGSRIIREYWHKYHNDVVGVASCRTYAGVVKKTGINRAYVKTVLGTKSYWTTLVKPKVDKKVIVHRYHVVEIISEKEAKKLMKMNAKYAKQLT